MEITTQDQAKIQEINQFIQETGDQESKTAALIKRFPPFLQKILSTKSKYPSGKEMEHLEYHHSTPYVSPGSNAYADVLRAIEAMRKLLEPCPPQDVRKVLGMLVIHKPTRTMSESQLAAYFSDYVLELKRYSLPLLMEVARDIKLDRENKFFPDLAAINAAAKKKSTIARMHLTRLMHIAEGRGQKDEENRPPMSEEQREYVEKKFAEMRTVTGKFI